MFHGTSSVFVDNILSHGLLADPPQKTWNEGFYKSLEGVYFACSLEHAYFFARQCSKAHGGNPSIVIADLDLNDAIPDEDNITKLVKWSADLSINYNLDQFKMHFFRLMNEIEGISIDKQLELKIDPILNRILNLEIRRRNSGDYKEFIETCDSLSRKLKYVILDSKKSIYNKSFRVTNDVKINQNKNKIVAIIEFLNESKAKIVHGGSQIPQTFFFQAKKMIGNYLNIMPS